MAVRAAGVHVHARGECCGRGGTGRDGGAAGEREAACEQAGLDKLPGAWSGQVDCATGGGYVTADVHLDVPVLFPGSIAFPFQVDGHAGAVEEDKH